MRRPRWANVTEWFSAAEGGELNVSAAPEQNRGEQEELLQAASGDLAAFSDIYHRYRDRLYRFIYRMTMTAASAEDLTHDVFLALMEHPEQYQPTRGSLFTFLCAIARCRVVDQIRRYSTQTQVVRWFDEGGGYREEDTDTVTPFDTLLEAELKELVEKAIANLPPLQRETLLLREYEGLSYDEIAIVVNSSAEVVKARLFRARRSLAAQLGCYIRANGDNEYGLRKNRP